MKAPMLEAYAGFKWVMFHMVFLMDPFWLKPTPKGWRQAKTLEWATWEKQVDPKALSCRGPSGPLILHFPYRARPNPFTWFWYLIWLSL